MRRVGKAVADTAATMLVSGYSPGIRGFIGPSPDVLAARQTTKAVELLGQRAGEPGTIIDPVDAVIDAAGGSQDS